MDCPKTGHQGAWDREDMGPGRQRSNGQETRTKLPSKPCFSCSLVPSVPASALPIRHNSQLHLRSVFKFHVLLCRGKHARRGAVSTQYYPRNAGCVGRRISCGKRMSVAAQIQVALSRGCLHCAVRGLVNTGAGASGRFAGCIGGSIQSSAHQATGAVHHAAAPAQQAAALGRPPAIACPPPAIPPPTTRPPAIPPPAIPPPMGAPIESSLFH